MDNVQWNQLALDKLAGACDEGAEIVSYIRRRKIKIGFKKQKATGAMWTIGGKIYLDANYFRPETTRPEDPVALRLIAHEALHIRQGFFTALSVYGELEAWQYEFRLCEALGMGVGHTALDEIRALPLEYNRETLKRAQVLMKEYAGAGYRIDLLPLYPLGREIKWLLLRK